MLLLWILEYGYQSCNKVTGNEGVLDPRKAYSPWLRVGFEQINDVGKENLFQDSNLDFH